MENIEGNIGYRKLNVYLKSKELAVLIYEITRIFPREELFGLVSQMRRAAVSIPANIVEGYGRRSIKERLQFSYNARGSLTELEFYIDLGFELGFINRQNHQKLNQLRLSVGKLLSGYIKSLSHVTNP